MCDQLIQILWDRRTEDMHRNVAESKILRPECGSVGREACNSAVHQAYTRLYGIFTKKGC